MKGMSKNSIAGTERSDGWPNMDASVTASSTQNTASSERRAGMSLSVAAAPASTQEVTTMIPVYSPATGVPVGEEQLARCSAGKVYRGSPHRGGDDAAHRGDGGEHEHGFRLAEFESPAKQPRGEPRRAQALERVAGRDRCGSGAEPLTA